MDAPCKIQGSIHVFRLVNNMCPGKWVHINFTLAFFISNDLIYVPKKLEQACSISRHLIYASKKLKQACSISGELVYMSKKIKTGVFYF